MAVNPNSNAGSPLAERETTECSDVGANSAGETARFQVKVVIHDGIVTSVLTSSPVDIEILDIDKDYEDYDALVQYEEELWSNPLLQSQDFTVAHFS